LDVGIAERRCSVGDPLLAAFGDPARGEVVDGRVEVVGVGVDGGSVTGSREGDIGQFSTAA